MITFDDFLKVDIRIGTIIEVQEFPKARKPAWKLTIDFGPEIGLKRSSAQIKHLYTQEELTGRQILAVVNFPPRQIADFMSEVLVLGLETEAGVVLLQPERVVTNGIRIPDHCCLLLTKLGKRCFRQRQGGIQAQGFLKIFSCGHAVV